MKTTDQILKIRAVVAYILQQFVAMTRLFERWFSTYERKAQYTFVASSLKDEEGIENYTAIIVRNDNPDLSAIIMGQ